MELLDERWTLLVVRERVEVETTLRALALVRRCDVSWAAALRSRDLVRHGSRHARRALPRWLSLSSRR